MEMLDVMYELTNTKTALELAEKTIRKQKAKLFGKDLVIVGLVWFGMKACKMLGEADDKRKKAEEDAAEARESYARAELKVNELLKQVNTSPTDKDICCDGKASITKKPE